MSKKKVAAIGFRNIGTDLMLKVIRLSDTLEMDVMIGIDPSLTASPVPRRTGFAPPPKG